MGSIQVLAHQNAAIARADDGGHHNGCDDTGSELIAGQIGVTDPASVVDRTTCAFRSPGAQINQAGQRCETKGTVRKALSSSVTGVCNSRGIRLRVHYGGLLSGHGQNGIALMQVSTCAAEQARSWLI